MGAHFHTFSLADILQGLTRKAPHKCCPSSVQMLPIWRPVNGEWGTSLQSCTSLELRCQLKTVHLSELPWTSGFQHSEGQNTRISKDGNVRWAALKDN